MVQIFDPAAMRQRNQQHQDRLHAAAMQARYEQLRASTPQFYGTAEHPLRCVLTATEPRPVSVSVLALPKRAGVKQP
jgi:hypothetical protein